MSFDLYREEVDNRLSSLRPVANPEPGVWDNFTAGAGKVAMQTFAKAGRAASMAAAPLAMAFEKAPGSTEVQDKFFKAHDDIFGRAVDYWTPKPGEVGVAGQVVGQLLGTLPMVFASPALTVAQTQLSVAEDMARKGVDAGTAQAIGATQAAGLGLGIWVPILGKTLAQRVLVGGAGFNVVQGGATRAISAQLAEGTAAEGDFKTFDPTALTLDVLLGAAFGAIAHINPRMRAEGEAWQKRLTEWGAKLKPSEVDALAALRQAQHLNADSMPGKPVDVADTNAHVDRMRQAIDDLANDRPVNVEDMPAPRFEADAARAAEAEETMKILFHGSQHEFDVFDISKIGTGQGAHTYGRGLYFAENQEVARTYQRGLKSAFDTPSGRVKFEEMDFSDDALAADYIARAGGDFQKALAAEEAFAKTVDNPTTERSTKRVRALIAQWQKEGWQYVPPQGGLYKVAVPHEAIAKMLDWDKPFSQQTPEVQAMLSANRYFPPPKNGKPLGEWIAKLRKDGDPEITFKELGIAGFKYLDQGSRSDGKGTSNYVLFDDALPKIIERNGVKVSPPETAPSAKVVPEAGKPAGEEAGLDPLAAEAIRFASENPDLPIMVGKNADGSDITTTPRQWLEDADATMRQANDDVKLFEIAAGCLFGGGR